MRDDPTIDGAEILTLKPHGELMISVTLRRILSSVVVALLTIPLSAMAQTSPPPNDAALIAELESTVPALLESGQIPGVSIAVIRQGELFWTGAYGVQKAETGEPVTEQTVFESASLSKPVFAYAVLRLADRGVLDLDKPLADYLPYERLEHDRRYEQITARIALSHGTGLPNWGGDRLDLSFDPGTGFNYSGEGYLYLQKTLEKLTGKPINIFVQEEVFEPLRMKNSSFVWRDDFEGRAASGHFDQGFSMDIVQYEEGNAAYSLATTADDYARLILAFMNGEGLQAETLEDALSKQNQMSDREQIEAEDKLYWGLGWGMQYGKAGHALWHWGHNAGFRSYVLVYPEERSGLVYFTNSDNGLSIAEDLLAVVVDDDQWALVWLDYEQHDDLGRIARRELERTFMGQGTEAGLARYAELEVEQPGVIDEGLTDQLGFFLLNVGRDDAAVAVLKLNIENNPNSSRAWDRLGEAHMNAGQYAEALERYEKSVELDPENGNGYQKIDWLTESVAALENPVGVPETTLLGYAGDYGPRHITLVDGELRYQRDGNPQYHMIPMAEDQFMLREIGHFRIRFVTDEEGRATKIVGMYASGFEDESPRDSETM